MLLDPALATVLAGAVGLLVGSFLNVVIHRLPQMLERGWAAQCAEMRGEELPVEPAYNLVVPRSRCPACGHGITALENIPVVSWLVLGGKCSACKAPISVRYPVVEILGGAIAVAALLAFGLGAKGFAAAGLLWTLLALTCIDFDTQLLPDDLTLPLLWAGLLVNLSGTFAPLSSAVIGAAAGYLSLWSIYWLFKLIRGKEGMGFGDFKLLAALGAWTGWQTLPLILLVSAGSGAVIGLAGIWLAGKGREARIPFGPYLAAGGFVALVWGREAVVAYLGRFPA